MGTWEAAGKSDEWYTPKYVFDALGCRFDLDVANGSVDGRHVPARDLLAERGLEISWYGFVWMNPPFGGRNGLEPWLDKFFEHGNGIALTPDRTSAPWWQSAMRKADAVLFVSPKIKFERIDGSLGKWPGNGTTLWACGVEASASLLRAYASGLGAVLVPAIRERNKKAA